MLLLKRENLEKQIQSIESQLAALPKGKLLVSRNGKYTKWTLSANNNKTYISKKDRMLAQNLAQRRLLDCQEADLKQELKFYENIISGKKKLRSRADAFLQRSPEYARLLADYQSSSQDFVRQWLEREYPYQAPYQEKRIFKSVAGINVRSKSEALIISRLIHFQIPYLYEYPLTLDQSTYFPDFTLLHPIDFSTGYLEHLGLMDNPEYSSRAFSKLTVMAEHGISPASNLFLTFEDKQHPLSASAVDSVLLRFLEK